ncbi:MAG: ABC transporter permease, partial [Deinococcota bacterium]|nr:ABC transporter permease [Deinococcota bacterium]
MFRHPNLVFGLALIGLVALGAGLSFLWLPHDPNRIDFSAQLAAPSAAHPLGTDHLGRDLLSRLLVGARSTLLVGFIAVSIALGLGGLLGALGGYLGGLLDELVMRVVDVLYAFPPILMAILLAGIYGPGTLTAMVAIGLATVPVFARLMRASMLSLKGRDFVEAAQALGAGRG